jgi:hypothetical protein
MPGIFKPPAALTGLILAIGTTGNADAAADQYVTFSAFGTLGAVYSDYSQADFIGNVVQLRGPGYSDRWSATPDSDLGAQANFALTDALSGVLQILSRDNADGNFAPKVEWANLKYQFTPNFAVRIGRTVLSTYGRSDIQNVGYALPWVRVPTEITFTDTAEYSDGLDVLYRVKTGAVTQNLQAQWGRTTEDLPGAQFTDEHATIVVLSDTVQIADASIHLVYQHYAHAGFPSAQLRIINTGFTYDPGAWFVTGDSNFTRDRYFGGLTAWYVSGGVRIGRFAPYILYATTRATSAGTSGLGSLGDEHGVSAGIRWDFAKDFDMKLQLQQETIDSLDDPASFANLQPAARVGDNVHVVSLALDFVF